MDLYSLRTFILSFGWPVLILGSIYIVLKAWDFYKTLEKSIFGKLVFPSLVGWLISMYSLGIVATFYMLDNVEGTKVVLPIFIAWFVTMVLIFIITIRWSKEAVALQTFYNTLEKKVKERTKELEIAHKKEIEREKQIEKLKDQFIFIAAHELRSPVNAIKWGLDSFFDEKEVTEKIPKDMVKLLKDVYTRNQKLVDLIENLLNVARLEEGIIQVKLEAIRMEDILKEVIKETALLADAHNVQVEKLPDPTMPFVNADSTLVKEVLTNLITNAIKYNKDNGKVSFSWEQQGSQLVFRVQDTGIGIPQENQHAVFSKFYRARNSEKSKIKGVGLGLYITKELIQKMKGAIWFESKEEHGTAFCFTLPLAQSVAHINKE